LAKADDKSRSEHVEQASQDHADDELDDDSDVPQHVKDAVGNKSGPVVKKQQHQSEEPNPDASHSGTDADEDGDHDNAVSHVTKHPHMGEDGGICY